MDHLPHPTTLSARAAILPRRWTAGVGLVALAAALLAGCSSMGGEKLNLACPKVGILGEAARVTVFGAGAGQGPTNVAANAVVGDFSGNCTYDETGVTIDVSVALVAERGPALVGDQVALTYFVAISKPDGTIVTKQVFPTTIEFKGNAPRAGSREDLQPHIPLAKGVDARGYQVLLGFQLTPAQLDYNRRTVSGAAH